MAETKALVVSQLWRVERLQQDFQLEGIPITLDCVKTIEASVAFSKLGEISTYTDYEAILIDLDIFDEPRNHHPIRLSTAKELLAFLRTRAPEVPVLGYSMGRVDKEFVAMVGFDGFLTELNFSRPEWLRTLETARRALMDYTKAISGKRDVFICHASEDKEDIVEPLIKAFGSADISYWYDKAEIAWGDSIVENVNAGLKNARYVLIVELAQG